MGRLPKVSFSSLLPSPRIRMEELPPYFVFARFRATNPEGRNDAGNHQTGLSQNQFPRFQAREKPKRD